MKYFLQTLIICFICISSIQAGTEWSFFAHRIVANIAQSFLSEQSTGATKHYLKNWNGQLKEVSTWADEIVRHPEWKWSAPLHYINMPRPECKLNLKRDCPDNACIVAALNNFTSIALNHGRNSFEETLNAIRFLVHFLGDVHQPLHVNWKETRGGNTVNVKFYNTSYNFHSLWDGGIPKKRMIEKYNDNEEEFAKQMILKLKIGEFKNLIKIWTSCPSGQKVCFEKWTNEVAALSCEDYITKVKDGDVLGDEYYAKTWPVIEEQFAKAGIRLAFVLNYVFANFG